MRLAVSGLVALVLLAGASAWGWSSQDPAARSRARKTVKTKARKVAKTDAEWAKLLSPEQFAVTRRKDTEQAFTGQYWNNHAEGVYACVCCGAFLFNSKTKFESGTGWPSFYQPISRQRIESEPDYKMAEPRVEVLCMDCGAHLGHVFNDGPAPTGLRYCINSASLKFLTESEAEAVLAKQKEAEQAAKEKAAEAAKEKAAGKSKSATTKDAPAEGAPKVDAEKVPPKAESRS